MDDIYKSERKFVVIERAGETQVIMGVVQYHKELVPKNEPARSPLPFQRLRKEEPPKVLGGGRWHWDKENSKVYFYGKSFDFGTVSQETLEEALGRSHVSFSLENCEFLFSGHEYLSEALTDLPNLKKMTYAKD